MKKFLSLMLAMIMVMSLVTVGAGAADFTDEETIQYNEAVAVMAELGILGGYTDGAFRPQGTLTRQAAAKIICNIKVGPEAAADLAAGGGCLLCAHQHDPAAGGRQCGAVGIESGELLQ